MDFYRFRVKETKSGTRELYPGFVVGRSTDLMVRGGQFYAIWDEAAGLWSTDEYDVARLVDAEMREYAEKNPDPMAVKYMQDYESQSWPQFRKYVQSISDNSVQLDQSLTFANTEVKKKDYVSKRLPYSLGAGDCSAWDELIGTLYSVEERAKIEWAIGAVVSGDSKKIQKFLVLYGPAGTGKSTILNIIEKLFAGYTTTFEAKALGANNNQFATEAFKGNPLVAIQHDGDLSRIEDNTKLNSIISHEDMTMNEKFKASYTARVNAFLFMGTNQPVKISDSKSGIIRRLIDVHPTGVTISNGRYHTLMSQIDFELGAIAQHCLDVYREMGKNYYSTYRPLEMMLQTDVFFNYIEAYYDVFKAQNGVTLSQAYMMYKEYCENSGIDRKLPQYKFREELRNYFDEFRDRAEVDGHMVRSYYEGFNANKYKEPAKEANAFTLVIEEDVSILDDILADQPAQLASSAETPKKRWQLVKTTLKDINTKDLHFVKVPTEHIVIDFDLKDENGEKSLERNLKAASVWPPTYAELSKGGNGVHLHYHYDGDVEDLAAVYSDGIEVKTLLGDSSLRRRLTKCNSVPVATINSGLPMKEKKVTSPQTIQSEKGLRSMVNRNLQKEFGGTKTSIDFIKHILDEAYEAGYSYDLTDMKNKIVAFANNSSNQPLIALKTVQQMKFKSEERDSPPENFGDTPFDPKDNEPPADSRFVFYDIEVYPNLFVVCWKYEGSDTTVRMINPSGVECLALSKMKLVGFNNRRYDNHILYARIMNYSNEELYNLSQKIIEGKGNYLFGEAYNLSHADIYDFSSKKQSLKKFEIELGLKHVEMDIPWDQPVPDDLVDKVVDYCVNDVEATEAVFEDRKQDYVARRILADLSGLTINDPTAKHTARIIFGSDRNPQASFVYTDLAKEFPGYVYDMGKSTYRGEVTGEGGYVYAEPGMYENVAVLDVASMHPASLIALNYFGDYTPNFTALRDARLAIKHGDYNSARGMLGGKLAPYLQDEADAKKLSYALKIVINIVYGLTSAKFDNPFRHVRNKDNIVAKRGALFMVDLKHAVQEKGFQVVHIKTDSIKIPNATPEIIEFVTQFGAKYGYDFEHEATYDKFCLVNDAVYIAREGDHWEAVGAQFQHPYVYKTLFTHEDVTFEDLCEARSVQKGAMYLDFNHDTPMVTAKEGLKFVGRTGLFVPVQEGQNGAVLYRIHEDKYYSVTGTKGYLWMEAEMARANNAEVDINYFEKLADTAVSAIEKHGLFEEFVK